MYLIIRESKKNKLGIVTIVPILKIINQELGVVFIDDTDFVSSRNNYKNKMQQILNQYSSIYTATGEYIKDKKTYYYY